MKLATRVVFQHAILVFLTLILSASPSTAQNNPTPAPARITQAVDENNLVTLSGNVHPLARAQFDRGPAPSDLALNRMLLVLSRSPEQAGSLQALLDQQQDRSSPQYHRWLTPQQFGQQFGPSDSDIAQITAWLQIHGFHDIHVSNGRVTIEFSGTAAQVQEAFRTSIHRYVVNGAEHWANATDPQIPAALAPVVAGVFTLHNFLKAPQSQATPQAFPARATAGKRPQFTGGNGSHAIAPADFYTIYNFNPLQPPFASSVRVAIVARTNINVDDVLAFHAYTADEAIEPQVLVNGPDPGDLGGGEEVEAVLDATWVGAMIPQASTTLVVSQSTATTDGVDLSENYIIDNNFGDVMSESFGNCEANFTSAEATAVSSLAQQAAAEGITYVVSSGDSGAEGCDDPGNETVATGPLSVNLLASNPYVVAVGGTIFNEGSNPGKYWNPTNNSGTLGSAISYIPENVWNESCQSGQLNCSTPSIWAGGGGASTFFTKPSWQTGVTGIPADNARDLPDVSLTAAGHDPYLICIDGSCTANSQGEITFYGVSGTSASTQAFAGLMANVAFKQGVRLGQPNYVLYRLANAENLSQCNASNTTTPPASTCVFNDVTTGNNAVPGELNYGAPSAKYQSGVGYDLATGLGSVNATNLINQWSSVTFNATSTTFSVSPTTATHGDPINISGAVAPNSGTGTPTGVVWLTQNGYFNGILTGDGTVDIFKLDGTGSYSGVTHLLPGGSYQVNAYYPGDGTYGGSSSPTPVEVSISPEPTTLTFSLLTKDASGNLVPFTSVPYGTPIYFQAQVSWLSGYGSPTGEIDCYAGSDSPFAYVQPNSTAGGYALSNAVTRTPVGTYSATAIYGGDYSFRLSRQNTPVNFSITSVSTQTSLTSQQTSLGLLLFVTVSGAVSGSGVVLGPTGQITFTNGVGGPTLGTAGVSGGYASFNISQLAPGQYNFVAAYSGDGNYTASTSAPLPMTLAADFIIANQGTTSETVTPGQNALYLNDIAIVPLSGYSSTVKVSCTVPAAGTACSVSPASYGSGGGVGSVTITTTAGAAAVRQPAGPSNPPPFHLPTSQLASVALLLCSIAVLLTRTRRRRFAIPLALLLLMAAIVPIGCGGGSGNGAVSPSSPSAPQQQGTPAGTYTVTVTGTAGSTTHTTTLTLIVQ